MICNGCGNDNPPTAQFCGYCGQTMATVPESGPPPMGSSTVQMKTPPDGPGFGLYANLEPATMPMSGYPIAQPSIKAPFTLSVILCVLNLVTSNLLGLAAGIAAAFFSSKVRNQLKMGDVRAAGSSYKTARIFVWISLALFIIGLLSVVVFGVWFFSNYRIEF